MTLRSRLGLALMLAAAAAIGGCASLSYYAQAARGQLRLLANRQPIDRVIAKPDTPEPLRASLALVLEIRDFAVSELALPDNDSYRTYVDIGRPYVVWNVFAAPEFSVEPKRWCFPLVGCLSYKGYFSEEKARAAATRLAEQGYDVFVGGIAAYSTLGHFDDPFLSSMLRLDETATAGIVFHEIAHQRVYVRDDTELNEAFASLVEEEGVRRWLGARGGSEALAEWERRREMQREFSALVGATREALAALYASPLSEDELRTRKAAELAAMRERYAALRATWGGYTGYDAWFAAPVNNARIASVATYRRLVPALKTLLADAGGDLPAFYSAVDALGELRPPERARRLEALLARAGNAPAAAGGAARVAPRRAAADADRGAGGQRLGGGMP
jgi:predicted aminopeptidase